MLDKLTPQEERVRVLLLRGLSSKEVARELVISPRTAERHRSNVLHKMRAKNTLHLYQMFNPPAA